MYYIGIDLGTSAVKLLLMDEKGAIHNIVSKEYCYEGGVSSFVEFINTSRLKGEKNMEEMIFDGSNDEILCRILLNHMTVYHDGHVEIQLNHLPQIWIFTINGDHQSWHRQ